MTSSQSSVPEHYQDVLVVEDDPIIALGLEDTITDLGIAVIRVAANVASALAMIEERAPQFALLDVGLVREKSFAIAERLTTLGIPFAFSTGYGADRVPAAFADRPRLPKPCPTEALEAVLRRQAQLPPQHFAACFECGRQLSRASGQGSSTTARRRRDRAGSRSSARSRPRS